MFTSSIVNGNLGMGIMALVLSMDTFSICLAMGMTKPNFNQIILIGAVIGLFHVIMPLIGILIGELLSEHFKMLAGIVGSILLMFLGCQMIIEFLKRRKARLLLINPKGMSLVLLALSLSLDSFSVGLSLGVYGTSLLSTIIIFGSVNSFLAWTGLLMGRKTDRFFGTYGELIGGLVLFALGLRMLFQLP